MYTYELNYTGWVLFLVLDNISKKEQINKIKTQFKLYERKLKN